MEPGAPQLRYKSFFTFANEFISNETERHARENPGSLPSDVSSDEFISFIIRTKGDRFNFHNIKKWSKDARKALPYVAKKFHNESTTATSGNYENLMNRSLVPRNVPEFPNGIGNTFQKDQEPEQSQLSKSEEVSN